MSEPSIHFTAIESEVLLHRLSLLDDEEELAELFVEDEDFDPARAAEFAKRVLLQPEGQPVSLHLEAPEAIKLLAECLEGSTFFGDIRDAVRNNELSQQKAAAYRNAASTAAHKIEVILGRELRFSLK